MKINFMTVKTVKIKMTESEETQKFSFIIRIFIHFEEIKKNVLKINALNLIYYG